MISKYFILSSILVIIGSILLVTSVSAQTNFGIGFLCWGFIISNFTKEV